MLIQHSSALILHRLSRIEAQTLSAAPALVAKYRGEMMIEKAIEKLDAPEKGPLAVARALVDKQA